MTSHRWWVALLALVALAALGCDRKGEPPPPPTPPVQTTSTQVAPPGSPSAALADTASAVQADAIPTEEDFEEEAEREISADNLEAELDKLEREIAE